MLRLIALLAIGLISYAAWNLYYMLPPAKARPQIQAFLNNNYHNKFSILTIEKDYSRDLFKQPVGYKLTLSDSNQVQVDNIFIQYNEYQKGWITYAGTDIERDYAAAKARDRKGRR
ncbi:MAG: hypothetical protein JWQ27_2346 [Ferruginibacter sp.]|nr:hypothetical protein [Ferruginibacter sp.]